MTSDIRWQQRFSNYRQALKPAVHRLRIEQIQLLTAGREHLSVAGCCQRPAAVARHEDAVVQGGSMFYCSLNGSEAVVSCAALDAMHAVTCLQQQFRQAGGLLPPDSSDKRGFARWRHLSNPANFLSLTQPVGG